MKYQVKRSITIDADNEKISGLIKNFADWKRWSPWTIAEPECKISVTGNAGEIGHEMSWDGEIIGSGTNTLEKIEDGHLFYDLNFIKPFKSNAKVEFEIENTDKGTKVTWTMNGNMPFFLFFMIPQMKAWISMDYDRGLRMLKEIAEKGSVDAETTNNGVQDFEGFSYVGIKRTCHIDDIPKEMPKDFEKLINDIIKKHGKCAKHWMSLYPAMDMKNMTMTYIAAVSDEKLKDIDLGDDYVRGEIESGPMLEIKHRGAYDFIGNAWSMGMMYLRAKKIKQKPIPFEYYWNSPLEVQPHELKTSIYFPVKQ